MLGVLIMIDKTTNSKYWKFTNFFSYIHYHC
ncbi:hypothetical protein GA0116948_103168 [Chitinophaga costaii]|uniref:Uncharacterized protein n=1 Tax=Chitinophaga costaii TaxID=1335309 RepID=A0A1C4BM68_9BACT|nr:hypothetical protein GA0116948_103168 [Chitinophaga costaii]